jgi:hypothetical protein
MFFILNKHQHMFKATLREHLFPSLPPQTVARMHQVSGRSSDCISRHCVVGFPLSSSQWRDYSKFSSFSPVLLRSTHQIIFPSCSNHCYVAVSLFLSLTISCTESLGPCLGSQNLHSNINLETFSVNTEHY